jgi:hypothetical protein
VFSPDAFLREMEQEAAAQNSNSDTLAKWLQQHPALYALQNKAQAGIAIQQRLAGDGLNTLTPNQCKILADFFDFWLDPQWLERHAAQRAIQTGDFSYYSEQPLTGLYPNRFLLNRIKRPLSYWRAAWVAVIPRTPMRIVQMGQLLRTSYGLPPNKLPPGLDAASFAFYSRLVDPGYFGRWRWLQIAMRSCVWAVVMAGLLPFVWLDSKIGLLGFILLTANFIFMLHVIWSGVGWLRSKYKNIGWKITFIMAIMSIAALRLHQHPETNSLNSPSKTNGALSQFFYKPAPSSPASAPALRIPDTQRAWHPNPHPFGSLRSTP